MYLLGVVSPNKAVHEREERERAQLYAGYEKTCEESGTRLKGAISRFRPDEPDFALSSTKQKLNRVISAFMNQSGRSFSPTLVQLAGPLALAVTSESELFAAFAALMKKMDKLEPLRVRQSTFLSLFRTTLRDVHQHFEDEELDMMWTISWLGGMLSAELPVDEVLQLWDFYFSRDDGLAMHTYVCISVLDSIQVCPPPLRCAAYTLAGCTGCVFVYDASYFMPVGRLLFHGKCANSGLESVTVALFVSMLFKHVISIRSLTSRSPRIQDDLNDFDSQELLAVLKRIPTVNIGEVIVNAETFVASTEDLL